MASRIPPFRARGWRGAPAQSRTTAAARSLGTALPISMIVSSRAKAVDLPPALGGVAQQRRQGRGQPLRRCVPLQEFRHHVLAQNQVGQDHALDLDQAGGRPPPRTAAPYRRPPSGCRRPPVRASRCPIWSAPRAPCGKPRLSRPDRSPPGRGMRQDATAAFTVSASRGTAGTTTSSPPARVAASAAASPNTPAMRRISLARLPGSTSNSGGSASRRPRILGVRAQMPGPFAQRMSDEGARRPVQSPHRRRLERQERQHMIDVSAHGARAARPPCPHGRTHIVDDRDRRRTRAHAPRDTMGEFRAVDDHEDIRLGRNDGVGGLADALQDFRQAHRDCGNADDCQVAQRKKTWHSLRRHLRAADTGKTSFGSAPLDGGNQRCAQPVA